MQTVSRILGGYSKTRSYIEPIDETRGWWFYYYARALSRVARQMRDRVRSHGPEIPMILVFRFATSIVKID